MASSSPGFVARQTPCKCVAGTQRAKCVQGVEGNWRWMVGAPILPALLLLLTPVLLPESPRWLLMRGSMQEAHSVLLRVYRCNVRAPCYDRNTS